jgi:hypothetical protein
VPLAPGGQEITSDKRIKASLPTIQYALDQGGGRLSGKYKSTDIYPSPRDPALKKEYDEYLKQHLGK